MHDDGYITLHKAGELVPGGTSANCVWRWCRKGVLSRTGERICLQHVRIGGKLLTTARWLDEFWQLLAEADTAYFKLRTRPSLSLRGAASQPRRCAAGAGA